MNKKVIESKATRISRRGFFKGAAIAGAAVACSSAIGGCAPTPTDQPTEESAANSSKGADLSPASVLNPQDFDYRANTTDFSTLFSGWKLGSLDLSHRVVKSAAGSSPSPQLIPVTEYYRNFAKGGIEMIWVEGFVDMYPNFSIPMWQPREVGEPTMKSIVEAVHAENSFVGLQLSSMGLMFGPPPTDAAEFSSSTADDPSHDDVVKLIQDVAEAAKYAQSLGFDAVEINAAGNNLGQAFFSRMRNHREDEYGPQTIENRSRFVVEQIMKIKELCGKDFIVQVLINAIEENDQPPGDNSLMTTVEENLEIAKLLEAAGADSLHLRLGPLHMHVCQFASDLYFSGFGIDGTTGMGGQYDFSRHWQGKLIANHSGCGMLLDVAAEFKTAVSIPVGAVTYMDPAHAPDFFEAALNDGKVDFLLMNRPLTVDTEYLHKIKEGRIDEIAPCTRCMHCHFDVNAEGVQSFACRVNSCTERVFSEAMPEGYELLPKTGDKNVMVIGGGPAGMEAARIAALRGYTVSLYEMKHSLGGLLEFANYIKGPHENLADLNSYLTRQMEVLGVEVITETEVDASLIQEKAPDIVILATGGRRETLTLNPSASTNIVSIDDIVTAEIGNNVAIVGANAQAVDVAQYLMAQNKTVHIVFSEPLDALGKGQSSWVKTFTLPTLFAKGMKAWPNASISSIGDGQVVVSGTMGADIPIVCDTIVDALDMLPNKQLLDEISSFETHAIGDCDKPWNIQSAIAAGNLIARNI